MKKLNKVILLSSAVFALASCASGTGNAIDAVCDELPEGAYVYRGEQSKTEVSFYSSLMYTLRDQARQYIGKKAFGITADDDEDAILKKLHDGNALWGVMSETSSAGYIYPRYYLYQHGYTKGFVDRKEYNKLSKEDQDKAMMSTSQGTYPESIDGLMTGTFDVICGFFDTRYGSAFVQKDGKYAGKENLFKNTYTVAVTDPIMNDTVSIRTSLSDGKREAIKKAFKAPVKVGISKDTATAADLVYQIYSHTGYVDASDSQYASAKEMYKWSEETKDPTKKVTIPTDVTPDSKDTTDENKVIKIQLVPSNDPATISARAKDLQPKLNSYVTDTGYTFKIIVGTTEGGYEMTTTALVSGQIDAAFLPAGSYASAFVNHPGKIEPLLAASRAGYKVQVEDFAGETKDSMFDQEHRILQRKAMNGEIDKNGKAVKATKTETKQFLVLRFKDKII